MAEYNNQKKGKMSFEEAINLCKNEEMKAAAIEFVRFLAENKMKPQWGAINSYNIGYKGKRVCIIKISEDGFEIRANTQYNEDFNECFSDSNERIRSFLLESLTYCFGCGTCKPGISMAILSKEVKGACYNPVIKLTNPDSELICLAEQLILLRRKAIFEGKAPQVTYIAKRKRV